MIRFIFLGFLTLAASGCTSVLTLEAVPSVGQRSVYQNDVETVVSKQESTVLIRPESKFYQSDSRPTLVISVLNESTEPFNFGTDSIQIFVNGNPVKIYTYDELVSEVKRKQAWAAAITAATSGASQPVNAGYVYQSGTYNSRYSNSYGSTIQGQGSYSSQAYSPALAQQARDAAEAKTKNNMAEIVERASQQVSNLSETILRKSTVLPNNWHGGFVRFEPPNLGQEPNEVLVKVTTGVEVHEMKFVQKRFK